MSTERLGKGVTSGQVRPRCSVCPRAPPFSSTPHAAATHHSVRLLGEGRGGRSQNGSLNLGPKYILWLVVV